MMASNLSGVVVGTIAIVGSTLLFIFAKKFAAYAAEKNREIYGDWQAGHSTPANVRPPAVFGMVLGVVMVVFFATAPGTAQPAPLEPGLSEWEPGHAVAAGILFLVVGCGQFLIQKNSLHRDGKAKGLGLGPESPPLRPFYWKAPVGFWIAGAVALVAGIVWAIVRGLVS